MDATTQTDAHSSQPDSDFESGILIYASHANLPKKMTPKEKQHIVNSLPHNMQNEIDHKLAHVGPISAIYLDSDTDQLSTITLKGMQHLQTKLYHSHMQRQIKLYPSLGYTLVPASDVQPYLSPLMKPCNSEHLITSLKSEFLTKQQYQCLKCNHSYSSLSAVARHTKGKHLSQYKHKQSPKLNHTATGSDSYKEEFRPPILDEVSCPANYHTFWKLKAKTRRLPPSNKRELRFVAPRFPITMLQWAEQINIPDLLSQEFTQFAQAYDKIVQQRNAISLDNIFLYTIGVTNSHSVLAQTGQTRVLNNLKRKAPQLPTKSLKKLTEDNVTQFFALARTYMLTSSIPCDSFAAFFLTQAVLGPAIHAKVTNTLSGYSPIDRKILENFTCFIERTILRLLPTQEFYYDAELRILKKHKQQLTGPNPSIDYIKTHIHSDAQDLTTKSPFYKQVHTNITDEQHRTMVENEKTNLLHKILANTTYDAEIHKLLIGSDRYKDITEIPNNELLDTLQSLIVAEEKSALALLNAVQPPILSSSTNTRTSKTQSSDRSRSLSASCNSRSGAQTTLSHSKSCTPSTEQLQNTPSYSPQLLIPPEYFSRPPQNYLNRPNPVYFIRPPPNLTVRPPPNYGQYGQLNLSYN